jgi:hypothetical protein
MVDWPHKFTSKGWWKACIGNLLEPVALFFIWGGQCLIDEANPGRERAVACGCVQSMKWGCWGGRWRQAAAAAAMTTCNGSGGPQPLYLQGLCAVGQWLTLLHVSHDQEGPATGQSSNWDQ